MKQLRVFGESVTDKDRMFPQIFQSDYVKKFAALRNSRKLIAGIKRQQKAKNKREELPGSSRDEALTQ